MKHLSICLLAIALTAVGVCYFGCPTWVTKVQSEIVYIGQVDAPLMPGSVVFYQHRFWVVVEVSLVDYKPVVRELQERLPAVGNRIIPVNGSPLPTMKVNQINAPCSIRARALD